MKKTIIFIIFHGFFIFNCWPNNSDIQIIEKYYSLLCNPDTREEAFTILPDSVSHEDFESFYQGVSNIIIKNISKKARNLYEVIVVIHKKGKFSIDEIDSAYRVSITIRRGRVTDLSREKLEEFTEYTYSINKKMKMEVINNTREKKYILKVIVKGKPSIIREYPYPMDNTPLQFEVKKKFENLVLFLISGFETGAYYIIDPVIAEIRKTGYDNVYISDDSKLLLSYEMTPYAETDGGLIIEVYEGSYLGLDIIHKGVINPKIEKVSNEYQLTYEEYGYTNEDHNHYKSLGIKKVNISAYFQ